MANLCFGVGIEEEGAVKLRRAGKRGTLSLSWVCDSVSIAMRLRAFVVLGSVSEGLEMCHCFFCLSVALCVCACPVCENLVVGCITLGLHPFTCAPYLLLLQGQSEGHANLKSSMIMSDGHHKDDLLGRMQRVGIIHKFIFIILRRFRVSEYY